MGVGHGVVDQMILVVSARAIRNAVRTLPNTLRYREFHNVHEVTSDKLVQAMQWLQDLAAQSMSDDCWTSGSRQSPVPGRRLRI